VVALLKVALVNFTLNEYMMMMINNVARCYLLSERHISPHDMTLIIPSAK